MNNREKIERLIEDRKADVAKKGLSKKFKTIIRVLGFDIKSEMGSGFIEGGFGTLSGQIKQDWEWELNTTDDDDDDDAFDPYNLPTSEGSSFVSGRHFDGLSSGINLQIYLEDGNDLIRVIYDGVKVFQEKQGNLEYYVPSIIWEKKVDHLFLIAEKKAKIDQQVQVEDVRQENETKRNFILDYLKTHWGI